MKINKYVLGGLLCSNLILLSGCNTNNYSIDDDSMTQFSKDKENTVNQLKISKSQEKEYKKMLSDVGEGQKSAIKSEIVSRKEAYYHLKNLNVELNTKYDYIFIVDNTDKFKNLYRNVVLDLASKNPSDKILVYFPNKDKSSADMLLNKGNISVEYKGSNRVSEFDKLTIDYIPTFIALKDKKVYLTLTGYYDINVIEDKLNSFDSGVVK